MSTTAQHWALLADALVEHNIVLLPTPEASDPFGQHASSGAKNDESHRKTLALSLAKHWNSLGFALASEDVLAMTRRPEHDLVWMHTQITPALVRRLGGHRRMTPMYANFPDQVMAADEVDLEFDALLQDSGMTVGLEILPDQEPAARPELPVQHNQQRLLKVLSLDRLVAFFQDMMAMNTVWTPAQAKLAQLAFPLLQAWGVVGPDVAVAQRENQAHIVGAWLKALRQDPTMGVAWPSARVSVTDVLRGAVAYAGGDVALGLGKTTRWPRLSRPQRRALMAGLEQAILSTQEPLVELHAHRERWLRLAEQLHVGEWKAFPQAVALVGKLRNEPAPVSWMGRLDAALQQAPTDTTLAEVVGLFGANPGYGARALRRVMAWASGRDEAAAISVLKAFEVVANKVDTPLLLNVAASFEADAQEASRERLVLPKGRVDKRYRVPASGSRLDAGLAQRCQHVCEQALLTRFAALPAMGQVYAEPGLEDIVVPKGLRDSSSSVGVVARGSWLPMSQDAGMVRLFLWWHDTETDRVDIDLTAYGVDASFKKTEVCNFQALKNAGMVHSGDLTSAPKGAAEFVDVTMDKLMPQTRYVVLGANVYAGPSFDQIPECYVGWQERPPGSEHKGNLQELRTVVEKFQVTCPTRAFVGALFDVKERRLMWIDAPTLMEGGVSMPDQAGLIEHTVDDFCLYAKAQPKVGRLLDLHVQARGGVYVSDPAVADVVVSIVPRAPAHDQQIVIPATQPQTLAARLMVGPGVEAGGAPSRSQTTTPPEPELAPAAAPGRANTSKRR